MTIKNKNKKPTVGLFGTCDNSKWRTKFIKRYEKDGIPYFNPDAGDDWHPGMIADENKHLQEDDIILFPVLKESLGMGSLGEIGFSILNVVRKVTAGQNQFLVALIDEECTDDRKSEAELKNSNNARKLVRTKLADVEHPNVFLVNTLDDLLTVSLELIDLVEQQEKINTFVSNKKVG